MSTLNPYIPSVETPPQKTTLQLSREAAAKTVKAKKTSKKTTTTKSE